MTITGSPDITVLDYIVTWDISGNNPVIALTNQSIGPNLANISWWFVAVSPSGTSIYEATEAQPTITGVWISYSILNPWPRPFAQIEWSGAPYTITVYAKDSAGNIFNLQKSATICRPFGNTEQSRTPYGLADAYVRVQCDQASVYFENRTYHSYQGLAGTLISSVLRVIYPIDETATIPPPFQITQFSTALVPITYSSDNYQFLAQQVYSYDMENGVFVQVRYQQLRTFAVYCNIDLCPLACEIQRLIQEVETGSCVNAQDAHQKLALINSKFALVIMGKLEPLCGIDVPAVIEEIKVIGGFTCNCCTTPTGIIQNTSGTIGGYMFQIVSMGGDINGTVTPTGNLIQFNLSDVKYVFAIWPASLAETTAFDVASQVSGDGFTKTYYLKINIDQLATDILNAIKDNAALVNLFNSIVQSSGGTGQLIVDGGCIFDSTSSCDFLFTLSNIPANTTFALLSGIKIGVTNATLSFSFNQTNLPALQIYLNGLGYGNFTVANLGSGNITISSVANPFDIQALNYKISGTTYIADQNRNCTGYIPLDANQVVQNIISYVCSLMDSQVATSQEYKVPYLGNTGLKQSVDIPEGNTLATLIAAVLQYMGITIDNLQGVAALTCATFQNVFSTNSNPITGQDFIFITKGGGICSKGNFLDVFNFMLQSGMSNATTKNLFCEFVNLCGQGLTCAPYDYFEVFVTQYDTACTAIVGIEYTLTP